MIDSRIPVRWIGRVATITAVAVALLLSLTTRLGNAQPGTGFRCETYVTFENRDRRVFGTDIAAECADDYPHSPPFGNWGVDSNYGSRRNGFQFPGWHRECTAGLYCNLRQWNSCTRDYPPPHPKHYNHNGFKSQIAAPDSTSGYAGLQYRGSLGETCASQGGVVSIYGNRMDLWELDGFPRPGDDLVAKLTYRSVSIPMTCDSEWDCEGSSAWLSPAGGATSVSADIRITVRRYKVICESPETQECF